MTEAELRQLQLQGELAQAQAQASATQAEVEGISGAYLQTVLRRPRAEWAKHIDHPELLPVDRQSLVDALAAETSGSGAGGLRSTVRGGTPCCGFGAATDTVRRG